MSASNGNQRSAFDELIEALARGIWFYRVEVGLVAALVLAWVLVIKILSGLLSLVGVTVSGAIVPVIAGVITSAGVWLALRPPWVRAAIGDVVASARIRRRVTSGFAQLELRSFRGRSVQVTSVQRLPSGWLLLVRIPAGAKPAELDADTAQALAAVLRVREVVLTRTTDDASVIEIRIVTEDPWGVDGDTGEDGHQ